MILAPFESWDRGLSNGAEIIKIRYIPMELWRVEVEAIADNLETGVCTTQNEVPVRVQLSGHKH